MSKLLIINQRELDYLIEKKEAILVNFGCENSVKIIPFYNKIEDKKKLIEFFFKLTSIDIRIEDLLGKLHLVILQILIDGDKNSTQNDVIVNNIGLSYNSTQFLIDNLNKIIKHFKNRNIYILENYANETITFSYNK